MGLNCSRISHRSNSAPSVYHNTDGRRLFSNASTSPATGRPTPPNPYQPHVILSTSDLRKQLDENQININSTKGEIERIKKFVNETLFDGTVNKNIKSLDEQIYTKKELLKEIRPNITATLQQVPTIQEAVSQIKSLVEKNESLTSERGDSDIQAEKDRVIENLHRIYPPEVLLQAQTLMDEIQCLETQVNELKTESSLENILRKGNELETLEMRLRNLETNQAILLTNPTYKQLIREEHRTHKNISHST